MGLFMPATWSRSLLLLSAFGLVTACDELMPPPQKPAPTVVAPVKKPVVKKPVAAAPAPVVKKPKPVDIDFNSAGNGGGGW
ncbi:hypothetical protein [Tabrizicola sp.]|uniref:hypothetical protein n=1 Tax=Tabrizicola sp. TaxID=2005166 RepID=UPI002FDEDFCD